jgi:hypothetical protein
VRVSLEVTESRQTVKYIVMSPVGLETENQRAGEDQQKFKSRPVSECSGVS